jgi:hypothetical protein
MIVAEQGHEAKAQCKQIDALIATVQEQAEQIQKVSRKPGSDSSTNLNGPENDRHAPQMAMNKQ